MARHLWAGSAGRKTLEHGDIFFFYHPKLVADVVDGPEAVAAFHVILHPLGAYKYRYASISLKELLDSGGTGGWWARMEMVTDRPGPIRRKLRESHPLPLARPCGEGVYAIVRHGNHTHLAYALDLPEKPAEVQRDLGISLRENPYLAIRNPIREAQEEADLSPQVVLPDYPPRLIKLFGERRFHPADPPELLDYAGVEFLIARRPVTEDEDLGMALKPEHATRETAAVFTDLHLRAGEAPLAPLFEGHWA